MEQCKSNILFITHYGALYGANLSLVRLIIELRDNYDIIPLVLLPQNGPMTDFLELNEIDYIVTDYYWWVNNDKGYFQKLLNFRKQLINFFRLDKWINLLRGRKIDIVYSNSVTVNIGYFISKRLTCPHIWQFRESMRQFEFVYSLGLIFSKWLLKRGADKYIVISDFLFDSYRAIIPNNRMVRIYNGVNPPAEVKAINHIKKNLEIVILGILCEQKNQMDALRALVILKTGGSSSIRLHLVGGHKEEYLRKIKQFISDNQLRDQVVIHGHLNNVDTILRKANIGLMCSQEEAFGRATIEYMLYGLPVIASNSGANIELIKEGENGFIYPLFDAKELARLLEYYIKQPEQLISMGEKARQFAEGSFLSLQNSRAIYEVIREVFKPMGEGL